MVDPGRLGLTRCEAEILFHRARGLSWIDVGESVGYCGRQTRRIFQGLRTRLACTEEELVALAQIIDLRETDCEQR